jgi:ribonuclease HII
MPKEVPYKYLKPCYSTKRVEVGLDECARSPILGRVYTAAVVWPKDHVPSKKRNVMDSKKIKTEKARRKAAKYIKKTAVDWAISYIEVDEINEVNNILDNIKQGWKNCLDSLETEFDLILVDGKCFNPYEKDGKPIEHKTVVKGDDTYYSIAAASVLAKSVTYIF